MIDNILIETGNLMVYIFSGVVLIILIAAIVLMLRYKKKRQATD